MEAASPLPCYGRPDQLRYDHDKSTLLMTRVIVTAHCSQAGARVAQPCLGNNGVLVIAEDVLDRGDGRGEPPGLGAADRCDGLGRVAPLLGPDADRVPLRVG